MVLVSNHGLHELFKLIEKDIVPFAIKMTEKDAKTTLFLILKLLFIKTVLEESKSAPSAYRNAI